MIYFVQDEATFAIKIGYTEGDPESRVATLQTGCPSKLNLVLVVEGTRPMEAEIHRHLAADRLGGEWFRPSSRVLAVMVRASGGHRPVERASDLVTLEEMAVEAERSFRRGYCHGCHAGMGHGRWRVPDLSDVFDWRYNGTLTIASRPPGSPAPYTCSAAKRFLMECQNSETRSKLRLQASKKGGDQ